MQSDSESSVDPLEHEALRSELSAIGAEEAAELLEEVEEGAVVEVLRAISPGQANDILDELDEERQSAILAAAPPEQRAQWLRNLSYPDNSVGEPMEPPQAVFSPGDTVEEAVTGVRELARSILVTYLFIVDRGNRLVGLVTMRDLLLATREQRLGDIMLRDPFTLSPECDLTEAMRLVVRRHFPVYPVCDETGQLVGIVRGRALFEEQAFEISAQPGRMVGVDKEERLSTSWIKSLRFRHPWLQLNLLTAFVAAAVVGFFQETIDRVVILAAFLPVLAGQSGNTGCQALAVALRGMTLGELEKGSEAALVSKEAILGLFNGALVGVTAGLGMFIAARLQENPNAAILGGIVFAAMIVSCVISGIAGAVIPLALRRLGADPATASSIFLTTATDVASMGVFLALATYLVS